MTGVEYGRLVLLLDRAAHRLGYEHVRVQWRSAPADPDRNRSMRRRDDGTVELRVRHRDRPARDVAADMLDGFLAAANVEPAALEPARRRLLDAIGPKWPR